MSQINPMRTPTKRASGDQPMPKRLRFKSSNEIINNTTPKKSKNAYKTSNNHQQWVEKTPPREHQDYENPHIKCWAPKVTDEILSKRKSTPKKSKIIERVSRNPFQDYSRRSRRSTCSRSSSSGSTEPKVHQLTGSPGRRRTTTTSSSTPPRPIVNPHNICWAPKPLMTKPKFIGNDVSNNAGFSSPGSSPRLPRFSSPPRRGTCPTTLPITPPATPPPTTPPKVLPNPYMNCWAPKPAPAPKNVKPQVFKMKPMQLSLMMIE